VTRSRDKFINGIEDLEEKTLALVKGYKIDEMIKENHPYIKRIHAKNITECLRMVSSGKAFATAGSLLEMSYSIRQGGMLNLKITGDAKFDYALRIGVRKNDPLLLSIMSKAVKNISRSQSDFILNKWISITYAKSYDRSGVWKILIVALIVIMFIFTRYRVAKKYNKQLITLNNDLESTKTELLEMNRTLAEKVSEETGKRLENERILMQQSKLAAMGDMIGAIAHQWRQPLNTVGLNIQELLDAKECGELTDEYMKEVVDGSMLYIKQMSATIDDFSNFFKPDKVKECFCLANLVYDVAQMFNPQLKSKNIELIISNNGEIVSINSDRTKRNCFGDIYVEGYPNEFKHVILNLIKNSMDELVELNIPGKRISVEMERITGGNVLTSVTDNGKGISEDIAGRIFEPYFSTKDQGKGVGLGLYMTKQIIENMNGVINFENLENGVSFRIILKSCKP